MPPSELLQCRDLESWRAWLDEHRATAREVWLVFFKAGVGQSGLSYAETLDEALCQGWIDSLVRRIDDARYARKFTPRKPNSAWSEVNRRHLRRLVEAGRMTAHGLALVPPEILAETDRPPTPKTPVVVPDDLKEALSARPSASHHFTALAPSHRREYVKWIEQARRPETRARRIAEALDRLDRGESVGLK